MAEPNPATWTATTVTATDFNTNIRDPLRWLLGHSSNPKPHIRLQSSVNRALTISTWTDIWTDTELLNRGGWQLGTGGNGMAIPVAGTYMIGAGIEIESAACNKAARIIRNSDVIVEHDITGVGSAAVARINMSTLAVCAANDVIKLQGWVDLSGLHAITAGEYSPILWAYYVATAD